MQISADTPKAGSSTALTVSTALSGYGTAKRQYGATINLPSLLAADFPAYGDSGDQCSPTTFTNAPGSYSPSASQAFDASSCPAEAKIGTVTLGSTSGGIYLVNVSPLPQFGIYFDTGTTPYGRRLNVTYNGSQPTLTVMGLKNASTDGLSLTFDNPARPSGLPTKFWRFVSGGASECIPTSTVTGSVRTYPLFFYSTTLTNASSASLNITGCGVGMAVDTDVNTAGSEVELTVSTPLTGTGNDTLQYGTRIQLPEVLRIQFPGYGDTGDQCAPTAFTTNPGSYSPVATQSFNPSSCPAEAKVGSATLGSATGSVYLVNVSPMPQLAVYFDSGIATPFGRRINLTWDGSKPILDVRGLPNISTSGLSLVFNNPARPSGLPAKIWTLAEPGDPACASNYVWGHVWTYPASGTVATQSSQLWNWFGVTGC